MLDQVGADGTVSKDVALQAFALASGADMPGVTPPAEDPGATASGSIALRWLVSYWDELTPDQQAAAIEALPELAGLGRTSRVPGSARLAVAREPVGGAAPPPAKVAQYRTDAYYTQLAKIKIADIKLHLPSDAPPFNLAIDAHVGLTNKATSGMETGVYDAGGGKQGAPSKCVITVSWLGDAQTDVDVEAQMAHEAWHCYEGVVLGLGRFWSQNPAPWIMEGEASWVEGTLVPNGTLPEQAWYEYVEKPELPLFQRTYDGVGYFGHLGDVGIDGWTKLIPVLQATTSPDAFNTGGANADPYLDSWAASLLNDASRPPAWHMEGPSLPPKTPDPPAVSVPNGASQALSAPAYGNRVVTLGDAPDVLTTSFVGRARLSDGAGHDYLAGDSGAFCMLSTGCVCPGAAGEPPPQPLEGGSVAVAVTGGPDGASGTLVGMKLDDYCNKGITGTWDGIWQNDEKWGGATGGFTLKVVQKGAPFTGTTDVTGPTCVRHGKVTGTVTNGHISMGWVAAGVRDVAFEGTVSGGTMAGTWTAIACNTDLEINGSWSATKRK